MYIKSFFKYQNSYLDDKEYKKLLKSITDFDLRRISKFNLLALYGSINATKDIDLDKNPTIYIATNNACVDEIYRVLKELKDTNDVAPFDFLGINTNNTGFYISKALGINALSYTISSSDLILEKSLELAFNDYKNSVSNSFLIGLTDSSMQNISQDGSKTQDNSSWLYLDGTKDGSKALIKDLKFFSSLDHLNLHLQTISYKNIILNAPTKELSDEILINKNSNLLFGDIFFAIEHTHKNSLYIATNSKRRSYLITLETL